LQANWSGYQQAQWPAAPQAGRQRAEATFGFQEPTTFEGGLRRTIEWYAAQQPRRTAADGSGLAARGQFSMHLLVTGAAGFIAARTVDLLLAAATP